jgi:hypothetical protein
LSFDEHFGNAGLEAMHLPVKVNRVRAVAEVIVREVV